MEDKERRYMNTGGGGRSNSEIVDSEGIADGGTRLFEATGALWPTSSRRFCFLFLDQESCYPFQTEHSRGIQFSTYTRWLRRIFQKRGVYYNLTMDGYIQLLVLVTLGWRVKIIDS